MDVRRRICRYYSQRSCVWHNNYNVLPVDTDLIYLLVYANGCVGWPAHLSGRVCGTITKGAGPILYVLICTTQA